MRLFFLTICDLWSNQQRAIWPPHAAIQPKAAQHSQDAHKNVGHTPPNDWRLLADYWQEKARAWP
jgi:hypothetical protein